MNKRTANPEYTKVYNIYKERPNDQNVDGYASHQPVLMALLKKIENPMVLELGIGFGSSPMLVEMSYYSEHYETDDSWRYKLMQFDNSMHQFKLVKKYDKYNWFDEEIFSKQWDIAFVDNAPGESRQSNLLKLADKARFIVCHDTEEVYKPAASDYKWDFSMFKYHYVFKNYNTFTTVVSNYETFEM